MHFEEGTLQAEDFLEEAAVSILNNALKHSTGPTRPSNILYSTLVAGAKAPLHFFVESMYMDRTVDSLLHRISEFNPHRSLEKSTEVIQQIKLPSHTEDLINCLQYQIKDYKQQDVSGSFVAVTELMVLQTLKCFDAEERMMLEKVIDISKVVTDLENHIDNVVELQKLLFQPELNSLNLGLFSDEVLKVIQLAAYSASKDKSAITIHHISKALSESEKVETDLNGEVEISNSDLELPLVSVFVNALMDENVYHGRQYLTKEILIEMVQRFSEESNHVAQRATANGFAESQSMEIKNVEDLTRYGLSNPFGPYEILEKLGHTTFATTFLARVISSELDRKVVLKIPNTKRFSWKNRWDILTESRDLVLGSPEGLSRLLDLVRVGNRTIFVMEYMEGGNIGSIYTSTDPFLRAPRIIHLFGQVLSGLKSLHDHHKTHNNIRLENILCSADFKKAILADFGISNHMQDLIEERELFEMFKHNLVHFAPELISAIQQENNSANNNIDDEFEIRSKGDIFALGVTFFKIITGQYPVEFKQSNEGGKAKEIDYSNVKRISDLKLSEEIEKEINRLPDWFLDLIERCLDVDPGKRIKDAIELEKLLHKFTSHRAINVECLTNKVQGNLMFLLRMGAAEVPIKYSANPGVNVVRELSELVTILENTDIGQSGEEPFIVLEELGQEIPFLLPEDFISMVKSKTKDVSKEHADTFEFIYDPQLGVVPWELLLCKAPDDEVRPFSLLFPITRRPRLDNVPKSTRSSRRKWSH